MTRSHRDAVAIFLPLSWRHQSAVCARAHKLVTESLVSLLVEAPQAVIPCRTLSLPPLQAPWESSAETQIMGGFLFCFEVLDLGFSFQKLLVCAYLRGCLGSRSSLTSIPDSK